MTSITTPQPLKAEQHHIDIDINNEKVDAPLLPTDTVDTTPQTCAKTCRTRVWHRVLSVFFFIWVCLALFGICGDYDYDLEFDDASLLDLAGNNDMGMDLQTAQEVDLDVLSDLTSPFLNLRHRDTFSSPLSMDDFKLPTS
ncbi:hypothetical protein BGW39_001536 [Mortierella sp. 14UC]|nr:hypothetical protein BGW39_001536 [Mortierella sp. 14UC]